MLLGTGGISATPQLCLKKKATYLSSRWCTKACRWRSPVGRHLCCDVVIG